MNIVCDKVLLSAAIDGVSKAVTMRSAIPVLEGILLKAEGFQLNLTGYDLEMGIVTTIEANVKEPGEIVLNAKLLSSMISRMPAGQITIQSADNGKTTIQSGVAQFEIQSMSATDFPELPNTGAEETLTIKTGVLKDMIDRTLYAVSQDEKKPAHTGELFEILPDKLTVVALDGYRLAIVERPVTAVKDIRIIVPSKTMTEVAHLLPNDDEEPVHISANRRYVVFMAGGYTMSIPTEDRNYRSRKEMEENIVTLLGGRVAEALVLGDISTGASNDIEKATNIARQMVLDYGFSEKLGAIKWSDDEQSDLGALTHKYSAHTAEIIDEEVLKLVETAHTEAWNVINENRDILDELVRQLLVKETLNEKELAAIFANIKKAPKREVWLSDEKRPDSDIPPVPIPDKLKQSAGLTN